MSLISCKKITGSAAIFLLSLFFVTRAASAGAQTRDKKKVVNEMTVIEVAAPQNGASFYIITFTRSQRRYKLPLKTAHRYLGMLKASGRTHTPVLVERSREESDTILSVRKLLTR